MRMFAIYCDDNIYAITALRRSAEVWLDMLIYSDREQAHTWAIHTVNTTYEITK